MDNRDHSNIIQQLDPKLLDRSTDIVTLSLSSYYYWLALKITVKVKRLSNFQ